MRNKPYKDRSKPQPRLPFHHTRTKRIYPRLDRDRCARCNGYLGNGSVRVAGEPSFNGPTRDSTGREMDPVSRGYEIIGYNIWNTYGWRRFCPSCSDQVLVGTWPLNLLRKYRPDLYRQAVREIVARCDAEGIPRTMLTHLGRYEQLLKSPGRHKHGGKRKRQPGQGWRRKGRDRRQTKPSIAQKMRAETIGRGMGGPGGRGRG